MLRLFLYISVLVWARVTSDFLHNVQYVNNNCNPSHHNLGVVQKSTEKANTMMKSSNANVPRNESLAVMILFSNGLHSNHHSHGRLDYLRCSLLKLQKHLMENTNTDVFIWALKHSAPSMESLVPKWFNSKDFPRMYIMEIEPETWLIPCGLKNDTHWNVRNHFDLDYYLMGRWRLTFSLDFARAMGYKYHLQFDDDALLNQPIRYDLVKRMEESRNINKFYHNNQEMKAKPQPLPPPPKINRQFPNQKFTSQMIVQGQIAEHKYNSKDGTFDENNEIMGYHMGVLDDLVSETQNVVQGLPELTAYWLKINKFNPRGPLLDHLSPKSINGGLYSTHSGTDGWDRKYYPGFFIILNLDYWYLPEIQDYLTTVLRSGSDVEGRWQEQAVINMMNHVFVPTNKLIVFKDIEVLHERHHKESYETWCVKTGLMSV